MSTIGMAQVAALPGAADGQGQRLEPGKLIEGALDSLTPYALAAMAAAFGQALLAASYEKGASNRFFMTPQRALQMGTDFTLLAYDSVRVEERFREAAARLGVGDAMAEARAAFAAGGDAP